MAAPLPIENDRPQQLANKLIARQAVTTQTGADVAITDLFSFTVPGNTLREQSPALRVRCTGSFAANANAKLTGLFFGAALIQFNNLTGAPNGVQWIAHVSIVRTGPASQLIVLELSTVGSITQIVGSVPAAENEALPIALRIVGQNGVASAGDISLQWASLELAQGPL